MDRGIIAERLDSKHLKKALAREKGKAPGGRSRRFLHVEGNVLRGYPFWIERNAPPEDIEPLRLALKEAQEWLDHHEN